VQLAIPVEGVLPPLPAGRNGAPVQRVHFCAPPFKWSPRGRVSTENKN
jgi:hypothetical protein